MLPVGSTSFKVLMMKLDKSNSDELPKLVEKLVDGWTKTYASGTVAVRMFII
jgi:hypothetical protein